MPRNLRSEVVVQVDLQGRGYQGEVHVDSNASIADVLLKACQHAAKQCHLPVESFKVVGLSGRDHIMDISAAESLNAAQVCSGCANTKTVLIREPQPD
jgi:hypothetical protein